MKVGKNLRSKVKHYFLPNVLHEIGLEKLEYKRKNQNRKVYTRNNIQTIYVLCFYMIINNNFCKVRTCQI